MTDLHQLSACEAQALIADRRITAEALTRACLERIESREAQVGAWQYLDPDLALKQARALDAGPIRGLLHGLPVAVKDIIETADMPTQFNSSVYRGHRPAWDAACVAFTRAAGGVILGKTVTTEFATFTPGKTVNPHNPRHTPGGSSSGSAAAVADCMVPLGFGTQTAGSVIRPAAYCGVVGYKPSYGLINRAGVKMISDTLDTVGVLGRTVPDVALFAAALTGRAALGVGRQQVQAPRIGICRTYEWKQAQPESRAALEDAAQRLSRAGARVSDVALPAAFAGLALAQTDIQAYEGARCLAFERLNYWDALSGKLKELLQSGLDCSDERYDAGLALAAGCRIELDRVFADYDILLAPSTPGEAPEGLDSTGDPVFNRIWTLLYVPCVHVPFFKGPCGLPVGVQAIGRFGADALTLAVSHWAHQRLG